MADLLAILDLTAKASAGLFRYFKKAKASSVAQRHLDSKYNLRFEYRTIWGPTGANYEAKCIGDKYDNLAKELMRKVISANGVSDGTRKTCGDLALVLFVINNETSSDIDLYGTETWKSLHEMGRGRGGQYALNMIKEELRKSL